MDDLIGLDVLDVPDNLRGPDVLKSLGKLGELHVPDDLDLRQPGWT